MKKIDIHFEESGDILIGRLEKTEDYVHIGRDYIGFSQRGRDGSKHGTVSRSLVKSVVLEDKQRDISSTIVWVILATLVAVSIYILIDANLVRIQGVLVMFGMSLYLIYDHFYQPAGQVIMIKAGDESIVIPVSNNLSVYDFNQLQDSLLTNDTCSKAEDEATKVFALR